MSERCSLRTPGIKEGVFLRLDMEANPYPAGAAAYYGFSKTAVVSGLNRAAKMLAHDPGPRRAGVWRENEDGILWFDPEAE